MRNTILAIAIALASSSALAANDNVVGGSVGGAQVSSGAFAATSGNGYASTATGGHQTSVHGFSGSSYSSHYYSEGGVYVSGVAGAHGSSWSETHTHGNAIAGSGTEGNSYALTGGAGYFDTHGKNPEGKAAGFAVAGNSNKASTFSAGYGGAGKWNRSGTTATFGAHARGNRDGGYYVYPTVDTVETGASASSDSYKDGGGYDYDYGNGVKYGRARTGGVAAAGASAEVGNIYSNN